LCGAAEAEWRAIGGERYPADRPAYEQDVASIRAQLGAANFSYEWAEGEGLSTEQAINIALEDIRAEIGE
jgi:hypothetical protein